VTGGVVSGGEQAGGLDHDFDTVVGPGDLGRVANFELADLAPVDGEAGVVGFDLVAQRPADGIVLEEKGHRGAVTHRVVHRYELDARVGASGEQRPVEGAPDAPEAIDAHTNGHAGTPCCGRD
jgi:hypothetical protein